MRTVDVVYSMSSASKVQACLEEYYVTGLPKHLRVERLPTSNYVIIFIDKESSRTREQAAEVLDVVVGVLSKNGHEPFAMDHNVHKPDPIIIDGRTGKVVLQMDSKHHFETLRFKAQECIIRHKQVAMMSRLTDVRNIWITGSHTHVRKVRRYIGFRMTNGNKVLDLYDLERIRQIGDGYTQVYFHLGNGRIIDLIEPGFVKDRCLQEQRLKSYLNNTRVILLNDDAVPNKRDFIWNSIFNAQ